MNTADSNRWPGSVDEAVAELLNVLPEADKELLKRTAREDLIRFHHGFGTGIRNDFGLWAGNADLLESCAERSPALLALRQEHAAEGTKFRMHPDDASMIIIEALWDALQQER